MAGRYTGRDRILVAGTVGQDKLRAIRNYCEPVMAVRTLATEPGTGLVDLDQLEASLDATVAAVYLEYPGYLGVLEGRGRRIAELAHARGALLVVYTDPSLLGVLAPPSRFGADLVCGDIQTLGNHMSFGGGLGGFIASRDEERLILEYPSRLFGIATTAEPGEYGFGDVAYDRTSFAHREKGKEFVGTAAALHGIAAGVYLALMGPAGMRELGVHLLQKAQYLARRLGQLPGVKAPALDAPYGREFTVDFSGTGRTVAELNKALLAEGIFGGKDLSAEVPALGQAALYAVTEQISQAEIDRFIAVLGAILGGN
jgi:glycine dehydrogenase subunit 1